MINKRNNYTGINSAEECLSLCINEYECMAMTYKVRLSVNIEITIIYAKIYIFGSDLVWQMQLMIIWVKKKITLDQLWGSVYFKKTDSYIFLLRTWFYTNFYKAFFVGIKYISKIIVFFLKTSGEYSKRYGKGSIFKTDP